MLNISIVYLLGLSELISKIIYIIRIHLTLLCHL